MTFSRHTIIRSALVCAALLTLCLAAGNASAKEVNLTVSCEGLIGKTNFPVDRTVKVVIDTKETGEKLEGVLGKDHEFTGKVTAPTPAQKTMHYIVSLSADTGMYLACVVTSDYKADEGELEEITLLWQVMDEGFGTVTMEKRKMAK